MKSEERDEMNKTCISIIVPVYNIEEYLPRCIESILNQTYTNLQLILVDDGSKDSSGRICDEYAKKDSRIIVVHKENGGSSSARNVGIEMATGEYLGFVDSDDYIEPVMYETMVKTIKETGCSIVQVGRDEIDDKGNKLANICELPDKVTEYQAEEFLKELLLHVGDCSFCTKLLKRDLFSDDKFPEGRLNEDFYLLVRILQRGEKIVSLPYCGYHVFYRIGSNTRKKDRNEFSRVYGDCVDNADMVLNLVEKNYPQLLDVAMRFGLFQRLEYLLHIPIVQMTKANRQYREVCVFVRKHLGDAIVSKYLTNKNKVYLIFFAIAPKTIRKVHAFIRCK